MTKAQGIASLAAIGGFTAVIALQTGLPVAKADELADLRANQQLLQQRIDQLAQAQAPALPLPGSGASIGIPGMHAAPQTPSLGGSFPRSFLIPGTDTSIRVGGFVDFTALEFFNGGGNVPGSNYGTNSGQNGTLEALPLTGGFVPGQGFVNSSLNATPSRNNGILEFSPQQSRLDIETRTPTAWGEARTFFAFDWAGCNNFSCQTLAQGGGNSILTRLRFAYGTLGGFLAGQALSNFSDADADTESMEFGGTMGSTGGQRIPQVRYTLPGPYGSAFSVSAENPWTTLITPGGVQSSDFNLSGTGTATAPPQQTLSATALCNGVACTGTNTTGLGGTSTSATTLANPAVQKAPNLTFASYWAQPWGHVDFAGLVRFYWVEDGRFISQQFTGVGGHVSGDVHPGWFGYSKDDILFSFVIGNAIGNYASGGEKTLYPLATNFTVTTACATPIAGRCTGQFAASNILIHPIMGGSAQAGYQHWWLPNLRSTIAAGAAAQDVSSQLIGPQTTSVNKVLFNTFVNLVWNPVAFVTTGVEYMYGYRRVVANLSGHEHVGIYKFRVAF
ncbi:MAG: porin [Alphaproteobacteria bacterium]|nr:porin [Alphaproteobacteria bacterium]